MADGEVVRFSYPAIVGLIGIAQRFWYEIDGACAGVGVDPVELPFSRFLNLVYSWVVERLQYTEDGREKFDEELFNTPDRRRGHRGDNVSQEVVDEEWALFNSLSTLKTEVG